MQEIDTNSYIVADKSMVAVLNTHDAPDHAKNLETGNWYKLIKCQRDGKSTIKSNKLFKPVKTFKQDEIGNIADQVDNLVNNIQTSASAKKYEDFDTLSMKPNHSKVGKLTVKVITVSRVITTSKGNYQICNMKDMNGVTSSINLYSNYLNILKPFKIYSIANLRKGEVTKNDETKMRFHTTGFTKVEDGTMEDSINFKQIGNGEESITGEIIGFGDLSIYQSCKIHYKKLDESNSCPRCNKVLGDEDMLEDCRSELYIEVQNENMDDGETEVKQILVFKRTLNITPGEDVEEKLNCMTGKMAKIDFNSDDAEKSIAVSIDMI